MEKYCPYCGRVYKETKELNYKFCPNCSKPLKEREGRQYIGHLRHKVFKRDNYTCVECGATNKEKRLEVDHIIPIAKGGTNDLDNLQTLCWECNQNKNTDMWISHNESKKPSPRYLSPKHSYGIRKVAKNKMKYLDEESFSILCKNLNVPETRVDKSDKISFLMGRYDERTLNDHIFQAQRFKEMRKSSIEPFVLCPMCHRKINLVTYRSVDKCPYCSYKL